MNRLQSTSITAFVLTVVTSVSTLLLTSQMANAAPVVKSDTTKDIPVFHFHYVKGKSMNPVEYEMYETHKELSYQQEIYVQQQVQENLSSIQSNMNSWTLAKGNLTLEKDIDKSAE